ncbi:MULTISPECIES: response regulator transcription factor [unclassified Azospirillum]|uniref:response regulator transcription factor n=1 Tax=unclassified Azospirillum TaxID=2630922 RepID=UPI000B78C21E|nr:MULTISPECIES: response regulator transcription factor [unclassified Azospirillum]
MMLDVAKLAKVLALADSANAGEAATAIETARRMLAREGKRLVDLVSGLAPVPPIPATPASTPAPARAHPPRHAPPPPPPPRQGEAQLEPAQVIARYGSREAALAPCSREKLLRAAVARWARPQEAPLDRWTRSLDGWTTASLPRHMPPDIRRAVETAYSLPTTIAGALAELEYWERRDRELAALVPHRAEGNDGQTHLDLPAHARAIVIRRLVEHGLRAQTAQDALARAEYWRARAGRGSWMEAALLEDLRHLARLEGAVEQNDEDKGKPSHFRTASERREEVVRMLTDPETASLSDREIARRVGVSPQTVGNLRRRTGAGE